ncbi:MAG: NAAT family transporter, partial [Simkania negevensis]|nr:NAAT family transporter [Simkania negevensis]
MKGEPSTFFAITFSLFLLMDSIGCIPVYVSLLKDLSPKRQRWVILRELFIALIVIVLFTFLGDYLLALLQVSKETISIAGGTILFIIALRMIFPPSKDPYYSESAEQGEPFIVPLAIPMIAGPSVLSAVMIYSHKVPITTLLSSVGVAWVISTIILISSSFIKKILGKKGLAACERLMGLILILIAIQMFL